MSKYSDPMNLFNALREREANHSAPSTQGSFGNKNMLKLQKGQSYSLRLLWLPSEEREYPMINSYIHHIWDDNAVGPKGISVICPTSQYDLGDSKAGFNACPICSKMSELYKKYQEGSKSAGELYSKFKRTLRGYVPVYVVNGPQEDKHKVKILQYSISFKRFFDEKIFGIKNNSAANQSEIQNNQDDEVESNMIGINAFMYYDPKSDSVVTNGHNLLITVNTKNVPVEGKGMVPMPDYKIEFSMKNTEISDFDGVEITPEYFSGLSKELNFDADFFKMSDNKLLTNFLNKYINGEEETTDEAVEEEEEEYVKPPQPKKVVVEQKKAAIKEETEDEDEFETIQKPVVKPSASTKKKIVVEEPVEEESTTEEPASDDELDLDELLKDI